MQAAKSIANGLLPWRFLIFFLLLAAAWALTLPLMHWSRGLLVGFDFAAIVFLLTCIPSFFHDAPRLRLSSIKADTNRLALLVLSFVLTLVILAAIAAELDGTKSLDAREKGLVAGSLILIWFFANAVYALHYAHLYYVAGPDGEDQRGLTFPRTPEPLMSDFVYFAFTLGVAVQTSDVSIESRHLRKIVTAHCVAGFFFNLGVLALTINVLGNR
jgi:uncharacterized membrane protein